MNSTMVGIVILDYNNASDTINCIDTVVHFTPKENCKIIVVENGSNEDTVYRMKSYIQTRFDAYQILTDADSSIYPMPFITLLDSKTNDGYAQGNNKALHLYEKDDEVDTVLILNNDILFVEDIITPLQSYLQKLPNCGVVSPLLLKKDGESIDYNCARHDYEKMQFFWEYLFSFKDFFGIISRYEYKKKLLLCKPDLINNDYFEIELPSGSCMLIDKRLFKEINYFDNNTFLYFEENILYRKLLNVNKKNYLIPHLRCIHLGASTSRKSSSMFTMNCQMNSTAYYLKKYRNAPIVAQYVGVMSFFTRLKIWLKDKVS